MKTDLNWHGDFQTKSPDPQPTPNFNLNTTPFEVVFYSVVALTLTTAVLVALKICF